MPLESCDPFFYTTVSTVNKHGLGPKVENSTSPEHFLGAVLLEQWASAHISKENITNLILRITFRALLSSLEQIQGMAYKS